MRFILQRELRSQVLATGQTPKGHSERAKVIAHVRRDPQSAIEAMQATHPAAISTSEGKLAAFYF